VKQEGLNYLNTLSTFTPGYKYRNQPLVVVNRWQKPGDAAMIQRFTTLESGTLNQSNNLIISDAVSVMLPISGLKIFLFLIICHLRCLKAEFGND
jgi:hypothetical protein